ncbi:hypothetical protein [Nocardioides sp. MH1]|uniref:hypothetical protein n=1 Tax=Nocardioides sp. MH1 TaxID=3242490 RepID=UPI003520B1F9
MTSPLAATITATLIAALLTAWAADLDFDVDDTAYWRRWLGKTGYGTRRCLLALLPAAVGGGVCLAMTPLTTVHNPLLRGLLAAAVAWAGLRADTTDPFNASATEPGTGVPTGSALPVLSALVLIYGRVQRRLNKLTDRKVDETLAAQRDKAPTDPARLLMSAQELASYLDRVASKPTTAKKEAAHATATKTNLYAHMDVLIDPLAAEQQRTRAAFALFEVVADEFKTRRWGREAAREAETTTQDPTHDTRNRRRKRRSALHSAGRR